MRSLVNRLVYADNAATTSVAPEVIEAMQPYFQTVWGNPSSLHQKGREAAKAIDDARKRIAAILECNANEI